MDRKTQILYTIINSYIKDGKAVGSRTIAKTTNINVSPATIRNDMSDLEDMGLLTKTHTSSGRIPSDKAYRQYIDAIIELGIDNFDTPQLAHDSVEDTSNAIDSLIENATDILARVTNYASISLMPNMNETRLRHFKAFPMGTHEIVLIYIYDNKAVKNNLVKLSKPFNESQLDLVERVIRSHINGKKIQDIENIINNLNVDLGMNQYLFNELKNIISRDIKKDTVVKFNIKGLTNLLSYDEFSNLEESKRLMEEIKRKNILTHLMVRELNEDMEIYIGEESGFEELKDFSVILGSFSSKGKIGKIGVIGPKRMEYMRVVRDIKLMVSYINSMANLWGVYGKEWR
mgnify:CR=1 FL=1